MTKRAHGDLNKYIQQFPYLSLHMLMWFVYINTNTVVDYFNSIHHHWILQQYRRYQASVLLMVTLQIVLNVEFDGFN